MKACPSHHGHWGCLFKLRCAGNVAGLVKKAPRDRFKHQSPLMLAVTGNRTRVSGFTTASPHDTQSCSVFTQKSLGDCQCRPVDDNNWPKPQTLKSGDSYLGAAAMQRCGGSEGCESPFRPMDVEEELFRWSATKNDKRPFFFPNSSEKVNISRAAMRVN